MLASSKVEATASVSCPRRAAFCARRGGCTKRCASDGEQFYIIRRRPGLEPDPRREPGVPLPAVVDREGAAEGGRALAARAVAAAARAVAVRDQPDVADRPAARRVRRALRPRRADDRADLGGAADLLQRARAARAVLALLPEGESAAARVDLDLPVLRGHADARGDARAPRLAADGHPLDPGEARPRINAHAAAARRARARGAARQGVLARPLGDRAARRPAGRPLHRRRQRDARLRPAGKRRRRPTRRARPPAAARNSHR